MLFSVSISATMLKSGLSTSNSDSWSLNSTRPRGPGDRTKIHSRSNTWRKKKKKHSPTHEIFILAWNFHSWFEIFILDWNFQSRALFFCGQRGARNETTILDWIFYSVLKAWFFQYCLSRFNFFNPGALWGWTCLHNFNWAKVIGGLPNRGFPTVFRKGPDCVADP